MGTGMRSAYRTLRDVKLRLLGQQQSIFPRPFQWQTTLRTLATTTGEAPIQLVLADSQPPSWEAESDTPFVQPSHSFGKWQWLLMNVNRLVIETDFNRDGPAKTWRRTLLVDQLENQGDFELWNCLLDHLQRQHGDRGVGMLWSALWGRKTLYKIKSPSAKIFWQTILDAALRLSNETPRFLDSVWIYAEWMREIHGTEWPDLYLTIIPHFLRSHQHRSVVRWQLLLSPNYYPGPHEFVNMMQHFVTDGVLYSSFTLQSLYITTPECQLYDTLVPYLYSRGRLRLANEWRKFCIKHDDGPLLHAPARPFLRCIIGYFGTGKKGTLHPLEALAVRDSEPQTLEEREKRRMSAREFMNRVHGQIWGISEKPYNDHLGARWFASEWMGMDNAITIISALGFQEIGPLSVQSIALREHTPDGLLARISQLKDLGISIPDSGYVNTIMFFAKAGEQELLRALLQSDFHPDVFDDMRLVSRLINASLAKEDWQTYMFLLGSRLVTARQKTANELLAVYRDRDDRKGVLRVLDDMWARNISLDANISDDLFNDILERVPVNPRSGERTGQPSLDYDGDRLDFYVTLCRRLASMDIPVPAWCWKTLLLCLGRRGRLDEFHRLSLELVNYFTVRQSTRPGFVPVHRNDVPKVIARPLKGVKNLIGVYLPMEIPVSIPMHPLAQIFDKKMRNSIIRWSFRQLPAMSRRKPLLYLEKRRKQDTVLGRAISLVRYLHDRGLDVAPASVQKMLVIRLAELYGHARPTKRNHAAARRTGVMALRQMKMLCDEAWGEELLPEFDELTRRITSADEKRYIYHRKYFLEKGINTVLL